MRKLLYIIPLFMATFAMSCSNTSDNTEVAADSTSLHIAVMPTIDCLPLYYAQAEGLFDSLGLSIVLDTYDAAMNADTAFENGHVHAIATDLVKMCIWQMKGDSVSVVMPTDLNMHVMTAHTARLTRVESIKEKIVAITRHSALDYYVDKLLEKYKMGSEELNKPQINNLRIRMQMLIQNQYDGAVLPEPYAMACEAYGARRIASSEALDLHLGAMVAQDSIIRQRADEFALLQKAYDNAIDALAQDSSNVMHYLPLPNVAEVPDSIYIPQSFKHLSKPTEATINDIKDWIKQRGNIIR